MRLGSKNDNEKDIDEVLFDCDCDSNEDDSFDYIEDYGYDDYDIM